MWGAEVRPNVTGMQMTRPVRRTVLVLHVLCGVGWMGLDIGLAVLMLTGMFTTDGPTAAAVYTVAGLVIPPVVPVLAFGMLMTGVLLGLGTKWGLVTWTWVFTKLVVGIVLTVLVCVLLLPGALALPGGLEGSADGVRATVGEDGTSLVFPPLVSFAALGFALVLSYWKPWGRTPWAKVERRQTSLSRRFSSSEASGPAAPSCASPDSLSG